MREYHIYWVDGSNQIVARHFCQEADDIAALEMAAKLSAQAAYEAEIWEGQRFVARVARDGKAGPQRTSLHD